jgi:hypothetical protein
VDLDVSMDATDVRRLSSQLFGNAYRLEVAAAIARSEGKVVNAKGIASEAALDYNRVQEQVRHFAAIGVLVPDFDPSSRYRDYRAVETVFWRFAERFLTELQDRDEWA